MEIRCQLINYEDRVIKKFTGTLINENGNTVGRTTTTNGKLLLVINKETYGETLDKRIARTYDLELIYTIGSDTTVTKRDKVMVTASDLKNGHINIVSTIGE